jgi:hypothetical protein
MTRKIVVAAAAIAIATGSIVSTAEAHVAKTMSYNPTYCILFLPFLCMPPSSSTPHQHHHKHA